MKRSELFFGAILVPLDYVALLAAGAVAYYIRISPYVQSIRPAIFERDLPFFEYLQLVAVVAAVVVAIFALQGLYALQATRRPLEETWRIVAGVSLTLLVVIVYTFLVAEIFQSRFVLLLAFVLGIMFVTLARYIIRRVQQSYLRRGVGVHRVALVGNGRYAEQLTDIFNRRPGLGFRVIGKIDQVRWGQLEEFHRQYGIDEIIQTDPTMPEEDNLVLLDFSEKYKISFMYIPNLFETHAAHVRYRALGGIPVVELLRTPLDGWGRIAKRAMDIAGALLGLTILSPLLLTTAVAIILESRGPVFYKQIRIGRNKQPFAIYKFRSMYLQYCLGEQYGGNDAQAFEARLRERANERQGPLFKMKRDPRVTRIGRFIRRWRIDELPQFINVLQGDMSLLGPRPHLPEEVARYDKHHQALFTIKPGMSGMAQVAGSAGLTFEQEASLDVNYIETWSLRLDIILLLKTFVIILTDKNAV